MSERLGAVSLASASPRRLQLLESLDLRVAVVRSAYEEQDEYVPSPGSELAHAHAVGKARAAASEGPPVLVAADTVVATAVSERADELWPRKRKLKPPGSG